MMLIAGMNVATISPASASDNTYRVITVDGQTFSRMPGIVDGGTTYLPIWYMMQALKKLDIQSTWVDGKWDLMTPTLELPAYGEQGSGSKEILVNGRQVYRVQSIVSGGTTFMPAWYIMQVLNLLKVDNHWDGHEWSITSGKVLKFTGLQNQATDDSSFWTKAGKDLYIDAMSGSTFTDVGPNLWTTKPNQPLQLWLYSDQKDVTSAPTWTVNSEFAQITPDTGKFTMDGKSAQHATFVATKPGIYTIQAEVAGDYSVPLVLAVGMDQLVAGPVPMTTPDMFGIKPFPANLPHGKSTTPTEGITYERYESMNGWLPVRGTAPGAKVITVELADEHDNTWTYNLPVINGEFSGMVRMPFTGVSLILFIKDYNESRNVGRELQRVAEIAGNDVPISEINKALLASSQSDFTASSDYARVAAILLSNAPSKMAGIAAINNFVSEYMVYDWVEYDAGTIRWQTSNDSWRYPVGVCQDYAALAAAMLRSVCIPADTVIGEAPTTASPNNHEWIRVYDGSKWIMMDPTWDSATGREPICDRLRNEYMTQTDAMTSSHKVEIVSHWS